MYRYPKRKEIMAFLNVTPKETTKSYKIVGNGMTSGSYSYEASETSETYIVDDVATTIIESYALSIDGEMKCNYGEPVYDFINELRRKMATGTDAETDILLIDKYDGNETSGFQAQEGKCAISISSYGGDGGVTPTIGFKISVNGNLTNGTAKFNGDIPAFTPGAVQENSVQAVSETTQAKSGK